MDVTHVGLVHMTLADANLKAFVQFCRMRRKFKMALTMVVKN